MTVEVRLLTGKLEVVKGTSFRANFAKTDILKKTIQTLKCISRVYIEIPAKTLDYPSFSNLSCKNVKKNFELCFA